MNKIIYLEQTRFVVEFQDIVNEFHRIKGHAIFEADSKLFSDYRIFIKKYYENNFGIELFDCWDVPVKPCKISNESKFNLFMLKYPHHIKKIVYE
jgi:hypothetical protein